MITGEVFVFLAAGIIWGAECFGGVLGGVSVSERVQTFKMFGGRFGLARGLGGVGFPLFPRTPFTPIPLAFKDSRDSNGGGVGAGVGDPSTDP